MSFYGLINGRCSATCTLPAGCQWKSAGIPAFKCISFLCAADVSIPAPIIHFCRVELVGYAGLLPLLSEQKGIAPPWLRSRDRPGHNHRAV